MKAVAYSVESNTPVAPRSMSLSAEKEAKCMIATPQAPLELRILL